MCFTSIREKYVRRELHGDYSAGFPQDPCFAGYIYIYIYIYVYIYIYIHTHIDHKLQIHGFSCIFHCQQVTEAAGHCGASGVPDSELAAVTACSEIPACWSCLEGPHPLVTQWIAVNQVDCCWFESLTNPLKAHSIHPSMQFLHRHVWSCLAWNLCRFLLQNTACGRSMALGAAALAGAAEAPWMFCATLFDL